MKEPNIIIGMDIDCIGCINWVKFSEIVFEGLIVGLTVVAAYFLGRLQSDRNWQREVKLREKEQKEKEENTKMTIRIDALYELYDAYSILFSEITPTIRNYKISGEAHRACLDTLIKVRKALPMFPKENEPDINQKLVDYRNSLYELLPRLERYREEIILRDILNEKRETISNPRFEIFNDICQNIIIIQKSLLEKIEELVEEFGKI